AFFVQHIPRKKWDVSIGENASDVGLLLLDYRRRVLLFEGDAERWVIPARSICSFKLEQFTPANGLAFLNRHTVVMLRVDLDDENDLVLTPLAAQPIHWRPWTPGARDAAARRLREAIGHLVDPERWPRPNEDELSALIPPAR